MSSRPSINPRASGHPQPRVTLKLPAEGRENTGRLDAFKKQVHARVSMKHPGLAQEGRRVDAFKNHVTHLRDNVLSSHDKSSHGSGEAGEIWTAAQSFKTGHNKHHSPHIHRQHTNQRIGGQSDTQLHGEQIAAKTNIDKQVAALCCDDHGSAPCHMFCI